MYWKIPKDMETQCKCKFIFMVKVTLRGKITTNVPCK